MDASITTIILTMNEEKNIKEAITSARQISCRIIVIDSGSKDRTQEIAKNLGAEVFYHEWKGYADQFNWALDNCLVTSTWVFRLDADERISHELANEIKMKTLCTDADGFEMRWKIYFMGKWIKHGGTHNHYFLRLFRNGKGRVTGLMDEHVLVSGLVEKLNGDLIHYDYKNLDEWLIKHIKYTNREMLMQSSLSESNNCVNKQQKIKRGFYYTLPLFFRARLYFLYRYYFQLGFLDGKEGKIFIFLQAYWYRYLVDAKIYEKNLKI